MKKVVWNLLISLCCMILIGCGGGGGSPTDGASGSPSSGSSSGSGSSGTGGSSGTSGVSGSTGTSGSAIDGGNANASTSSPAVTPPSTGVFLDSAIENIKYRTKTLSGYTNAQGEFKYLAGETIIFSIGSIDLPEVAAGATITPLDLAKKSSNPANALDNLLVLLQSLDADQDPTNGIKLTEESKSLSKTGFDLNVSPSEFSKEGSPLLALIVAAKVRDKTGALATSAVSLQSARAHFALLKLNTQSVAVPTTSGTAMVGNTITLNGSTSFAAKNDLLMAYSWSLENRPDYSLASIKNSNSSIATLAIDVAGDYLIQLSVTNSTGVSGTTLITVKGTANPKFGSSILTLYATRTGTDLSCNGGEDAAKCDERLSQLIHNENIGCVTCDATQADSICNINGQFGSLSGTRSIWNTGTNQYGNVSNESSPWNSMMGGSGQGKILRLTPLLYTAFNKDPNDRPIAFTLNAENYWLGPYLPDTVREPLLLDMLTAYKEAGSSAFAKREAVCSKLSEAMQ